MLSFNPWLVENAPLSAPFFHVDAINLQAPEEDPALAAQRSEKQKMAAMLFGGTGPAKSGLAAASRPARISTSGTATTVAAAVVSRSAVGTPASSSSTSPHLKAAASSAAAAAPPAAADPVDLLDFMSTGEDSTPASPPATAINGAVQDRSSTSSDQLGMDFLGGGGSIGADPSSPPSTTQTLDDLLGGGGSSSNGDVAGSVQGVTNGRRNSSGSAAGEQAWPPAARQRAGTAGSTPSPSGSVGTASLIGGTGKSGDLDLSGLLLGGAGARGSGGFSFDGHAVKPLAIATGEFGQKWMACSGERRAAGAGLSPGLRSPKAVADRLCARLGVHTVEIIPHTAEGICAGQLDGGGVCLVHCKVGRRTYVREVLRAVW